MISTDLSLEDLSLTVNQEIHVQRALVSWKNCLRVACALSGFVEMTFV